MRAPCTVEEAVGCVKRLSSAGSPLYVCGCVCTRVAMCLLPLPLVPPYSHPCSGDLFLSQRNSRLAEGNGKVTTARNAMTFPFLFHFSNQNMNICTKPFLIFLLINISLSLCFSIYLLLFVRLTFHVLTSSCPAFSLSTIYSGATRPSLPFPLI